MDDSNNKDLPSDQQVEDNHTQSVFNTSKNVQTDSAFEGYDMISFMYPGHPEPIAVTNGEQMVVGRRDEERQWFPEVDLANVGGYSHGVSRKHAQIRQVSGTYFLEDFGSSNGTWLNDTQIFVGKRHALNNGDRVRFGKLELFIFFLRQAPEKEISDSTDPIKTGITYTDTKTMPTRLSDQDIGNRVLILYKQGFHDGYTGVTPDILMNIILPFIEIVDELQTIVNNTHNLPTAKVSLQEYQFKKDLKCIELHIIYAHSIIHFLNQKVAFKPTQRPQFSEDDYSNMLTYTPELSQLVDVLGDTLFNSLNDEQRLSLMPSLRDALRPLMALGICLVNDTDK